MKIDRTIALTGTVAALAFAAGRLGLPAFPEATASPQSHQEHKHDEHAAQQAGQEMSAAMEAAMRAGTPGEHHLHLQRMAGTFDAAFRMWEAPGAPPMEMTGTIEREWILDGHYLREEIESTTPMGTFRGLGFIGYSNIDGQYQVAWMDSMSTQIMVASGSYDADANVMRFTSNVRDPATGQLIAVRSELDLSDPDRQVYREWGTAQDGRERKIFEGVAERR